MDYICPVCNGFVSLELACSRCGNRLEDGGRLYDYYGNYSPYREIEDAKMDNGYLDRAQHQCLHTGWCPQCRVEQTVSVREWTTTKLNAQKDAYK